eukprot:CAMPEP_0114549340 /NCGR_PEP_ID=MMETSP0114-20121206/5476_1 /TAXON_ID=31324 /ORGANISM="Goniomonas sp, Strain m" /LENGTH=202 /DNA_ID=CAMNT_0001734017 /DNA_START=66 /DNA_END=674 /DNA_ORIENTATION=-
MMFLTNFVNPDCVFRRSWLHDDGTYHHVKPRAQYPLADEATGDNARRQKRKRPETADLVTTKDFTNFPSFEFLTAGDAAIVRVLTPGLAKDDLSVRVDGRNLIIAGGFKQEENETETRKRRYQQFTRSWTLPPELDLDQVSADYTDGVLEVRLPLAVKRAQEARTVSITTGSQLSAQTKPGEPAKPSEPAETKPKEPTAASA